MTTIFQPHTINEAFDILNRPLLVQITAGGPPPNPDPQAVLMDVSRLAAMSGLHYAGGELFVGVNTTYSTLLHSHLLWPAAACLLDACRLREANLPGGTLLHDFTTVAFDNPLLLALIALHAQAQIAIRPSGQQPQILTLPLQKALLHPPNPPYLLLGFRFIAGSMGTTSALIQHQPMGPLQPDALAAATWLTIDPQTNRIAAMRVAFANGRSWPILCEDAFKVLIGQPANANAVEAAVRLSQDGCPQPRHRTSTPPFSLTLSPHLIRETLDRAIARSHHSPN